MQKKIRYALDESRILILGSQVITGFQWRAIFEKGYGTLPTALQYLGLLSLLLLLFVIGLLIAPACYHSLVRKGEDRPDVHQFTTRSTETALPFFAIAIGISLYLSTSTITTQTTAISLGVISFLTAIFAWFGVESVYTKSPETNIKTMGQQEPTPTSQKIDHVLTEARMVLPGVQALMGFQFIAFFTESFQALPEFSKHTHLASLLLVALCGILLMTPAAFHRIVEKGENTERFYNVADCLVIAAMVPLAFASAMDFYVVTEKVSHNQVLAFSGALILLLFFLGLWFGYTLYLRQKGSSA